MHVQISACKILHEASIWHNKTSQTEIHNKFQGDNDFFLFSTYGGF